MTAKIFYSGGKEYEYEEGDKPPARDVQLILQDDGDGPYFTTGGDYYILRDGRWLGVDIFGLFDFLIDSGLVLFGRTITNEEYQRIYQKAKVVKNTWRPRERKP